jgi:hypothetical protein
MRNKIALTLIAVVLILGTGCVNHDHAQKALDDAGMTNITTGGYGWMACSEDDTFATRFQATNVNGKTVTGTVCSGLFKGSTIRYD